MNRVIACALLGFGLVSGVVGCGDDDDGDSPNTAGTDAGGTSSGGKGGGGSSAAGSDAGGKGGTGGATGGSGGSANGGSPAGGKAGASNGGEAPGGEGGGGGDSVVGGAGGEGGDGAGGAPPTEPQVADPEWLSYFCHAISMDELGCTNSPEWFECFDPYSHYLPDVGDLEPFCLADDPENGDITKTLEFVELMRALAAACPDPQAEDFSCSISGSPSPKDTACRDAYAAVVAGKDQCETPPP